jgi:hypothetical protein
VRVPSRSKKIASIDDISGVFCTLLGSELSLYYAD